MRKTILFQIAIIVAGFMIVLLVIIEAAISHSSIRLFTEAKEELLGRDMEAISEDVFIRGCVPELMDYCIKHMDEVSSDVTQDPDFREAYKQFFPGLLERYGVEKYDDLSPTDFPAFSPEEQAVYAHLWYNFLTSYISDFQGYYGFSGMAIIDVIGENHSRIFSFGTTETSLDKETLEGVIADENERNGTLGKIVKKEQAEPEFGIAYSGEKGNWLIGYYPVLSETENTRYAVCVATDLKQFNKSLATQLKQILAFGFAVIAVFAGLLIWFLNRKVVRPVTRIQQSVRRYTDDKDTGKIVTDMEKVRMGNEIGMLAGDISHLAEEMERYTQENIDLVAEQERINTEMNLARNIQTSTLPSRFPAFPERREFNLYASMTPAKEVGGDFYDYFLINDEYLALVIADVSGKGIPAALFMMTAKSLIRDQLIAGRDPAAALERVNAQLSEGNTSVMFVTVWLAVVELSTGKGFACNAGHEDPVFKHTGGDFELLQYKHDRFVGPWKKACYHNRPFELHAGDCIFVYTDGVPETRNEDGEMFGEGRLTETLNQHPNAEPEKLIRYVHDVVNHFAGNAEQFDDITMLCFQFYGAQGQKEETN